MVFRIKITENIVLESKSVAASNPIMVACCCRLLSSRCRNCSTIETRSPGTLACTPVIANEPRIPTSATPAKSSKPNEIWMAITAIIFFLSDDERRRTERVMTELLNMHTFPFTDSRSLSKRI